MKKSKFKISGLSILEALVSTAIVGIGFIAILQMTNFSVQSIDRSGERTKANYLTEMIAEDVMSPAACMCPLAEKFGAITKPPA